MKNHCYSLSDISANVDSTQKQTDTFLGMLKGATSQVAGSPAVLDQTVIVLDRTIIVLDLTIIVLDRTIIVLDRTVIVLDRIVIVLDRSVIAIYGILSLNFLRPGCGSDRLWLLRAVRHTSAPALPTLSCLSGDRHVNKTLPRAGLFPGARSCAFNTEALRLTKWWPFASVAVYNHPLLLPQAVYHYDNE